MKPAFRSLRALLALFVAGLAAAASAATPPPILPAPPPGAPNVVVVLLDDVGFGATATFGGPVATPALDALAAGGLRYNRFHTTAICSPTRAALLTGRDAHATGVGTVMNSANAHPGYTGVLKRETATIATMLRANGYSTAAFGKWHLAPDREISQAGPFTRWPTGVGFDTFYGFMGGETDQFAPTLYSGTTPVAAKTAAGYHLTTDLVDHAIDWLHMQQSVTGGRPFFLYLAPGATHAPLQAPAAAIAAYRGRFDQGWDALREQIVARQKAAGVIPADTQLTPRMQELPAWDSLSADERRVASRLMEVYAGFLAHTDAEVGRLADALKEAGVFENTLFVYIVGDNGASAEGRPQGSANYFGALQGLPEPVASKLAKLAKLDELGSASTYPHYNAGWAWALDTPFQWTKQAASHLGGTRNGMVLSWPRRVGTAAGGLRSQFAHVNDITPTILEAAGIVPPREVEGARQLPMDGTSLLYSIADAGAPERHRTQFFEVYGNRAIYHEGWIAGAFHGRAPWTVGVPGTPRRFEDDRWELYDLSRDFSQARDLAAAEPARLRALQRRFEAEAERLGILPLHDSSTERTPMPNLAAGRERFVYRAGTTSIPESNAPRLLGRSWRLAATVAVPPAGAQGVIATMGGRSAGWSLWLDAGSVPRFAFNSFDAARVDLGGGLALLPGEHRLEVDFDYDGGGFAKGATVALRIDGNPQGTGRLALTPPMFFSIDETFDIGLDSGSPAGAYAPGFAFTGTIGRVELELR